MVVELAMLLADDAAKLSVPAVTLVVPV